MTQPRTFARAIIETVTAGQIAYEAHHGDDARPYATLLEAERAKWEHTAAAVLDAAEDVPLPPVQRVETRGVVPGVTPPHHGWSTGTLDADVRPVVTATSTAPTTSDFTAPLPPSPFPPFIPSDS